MEDNALNEVIQNAAHGRTLVEDSRYVDAADAFGKATALCRESLASLYCSQISALISAEKYDDARKVSDSSTRIAPRNSMIWYWNGMVLFKLNEKDKAKIAFKKALTWETDLSKKTSHMDWVNRCAQLLPLPNAVVSNAQPVQNGTDSEATARTVPVTRTPTTPTPSAPVIAQPPKDTVRMNWYQSATHVNVDIYAKNVQQEESTVAIEDSCINLLLKRPNAEDYVFKRELFDKIISSESTWTISRFKFEARLKKASPGGHWRALDKDAEDVSAVVQAGEESRRMKDARQVQEKQWKQYAEDELKDYKEDDSAMSLFRTIYKDADEDMRRAMMKSYTESGGKVLSTNWDDVRKKKVEYEEKD